MRKLLIVACLSLPVFIAMGQNRKKDKKKETAAVASTNSGIDYKEPEAPLPPLRIYTREGKHMTDQDLKNDASLIVMLFNPTCEHCEQQTIDFRDHIYLFKKTNLMLLAAPGMGPYLGYFTTNTKIEQYPTIQVGLDSAEYIEKTFKYVTLPQINIYDKERKLVKMFYGYTPLDSLKQYIE